MLNSWETGSEARKDPALLQGVQCGGCTVAYEKSSAAGESHYLPLPVLWAELGTESAPCEHLLLCSGMESHQRTTPLRALLWLPCSQHQANAFVTQTDPKGHFSGSWPNQDCLPIEEHTLFGEKPLAVSFVWHQNQLRGAFFFFKQPAELAVLSHALPPVLNIKPTAGEHSFFCLAITSVLSCQ